MKNTLKNLWNGIKAVFTAVIDWFATLFGMKDDSKYGRVMRGIVSTSFAIVIVVGAATALYGLGRSLSWRIDNLLDDSDEECYDVEYISENLSFYDCYENEGYLRNGRNKKVLTGVEWISMPMKGDSLVCYSNGHNRGYFHMSDGHVVVKPKYQHAWVFSEGLAAVDEFGHVKFINPQGKVVIDKHFVYNRSDQGYVFHNGRCVVRDGESGNMGLIDRSGEWVLPPVYDDIALKDSFMLLSMGEQQAVLTLGMDTVIPMTVASFVIGDSFIMATMADHSQQSYSLQGQLVKACEIRDVVQMMYETQEVTYPGNVEGYGYTDDYNGYTNPIQRKDVATCLRYEAELDWYGLMSRDGKILTPPSYVCITAVEKDLYLCETSYGRGVILNSKGERVE